MSHALDPSKARKGVLQQPPGRPHPHRHPMIPEFCQAATCLFFLHRGRHIPPHQEVSHQFQEAIRSWTETGNNPETPGHWRDLHLLAVSMVGWPRHHLKIRPPGLSSHLC